MHIQHLVYGSLYVVDQDEDELSEEEADEILEWAASSGKRIPVSELSRSAEFLKDIHSPVSHFNLHSIANRGSC